MWILRWKDELELSGWAQCKHERLTCVRRRVSLREEMRAWKQRLKQCDFKMEKGECSWSLEGKGKEVD